MCWCVSAGTDRIARKIVVSVGLPDRDYAVGASSASPVGKPPGDSHETDTATRSPAAVAGDRASRSSGHKLGVNPRNVARAASGVSRSDVPYRLTIVCTAPRLPPSALLRVHSTRLRSRLSGPQRGNGRSGESVADSRSTVAVSAGVTDIEME